MPPKAKFTKQQIADAALQIVRDEGIEHLTSRNLGKQLGSSSCPIFTVFANMEEVEAAMLESAKAVYREYVEEGFAQEIPFRGVGEQYVRFAVNEPKLFQVLFMNETKELPSLESALPMLDESYETILRSVMACASIDRETSVRLYRHLWIYTHGIACLCATKTCQFSGQEIRSLTTEIYQSLLKTLE